MVFLWVDRSLLFIEVAAGAEGKTNTQANKQTNKQNGVATLVCVTYNTSDLSMSFKDATVFSDKGSPCSEGKVALVGSFFVLRFLPPPLPPPPLPSRAKRPRPVFDAAAWATPPLTSRADLRMVGGLYNGEKASPR